MSVSFGDQRVRLRTKTIPLYRIGRFRCTRHQLCRLQAQRKTGTPIQWQIVGFQSGPPDFDQPLNCCSAQQVLLGNFAGFYVKLALSRPVSAARNRPGVMPI